MPLLLTTVTTVTTDRHCPASGGWTGEHWPSRWLRPWCGRSHRRRRTANPGPRRGAWSSPRSWTDAGAPSSTWTWTTSSSGKRRVTRGVRRPYRQLPGGPAARQWQQGKQRRGCQRGLRDDPRGGHSLRGPHRRFAPWRSARSPIHRPWSRRSTTRETVLERLSQLPLGASAGLLPLQAVANGARVISERVAPRRRHHRGLIAALRVSETEPTALLTPHPAERRESARGGRDGRWTRRRRPKARSHDAPRDRRWRRSATAGLCGGLVCGRPRSTRGSARRGNARRLLRAAGTPIDPTVRVGVKVAGARGDRTWTGKSCGRSGTPTRPSSVRASTCLSASSSAARCLPWSGCAGGASGHLRRRSMAWCRIRRSARWVSS